MARCIASAGQSKNKSQFSEGPSDGKLIGWINECSRGPLKPEMEGCGEEEMEDGVLLLFTFRVCWRDESAGQDGEGT